MATQGGIIEQKTIGIQIGLSGTHNKTDIVNGQVQLKPIDTDFGGIAYAEEGSWTSDVIDIGDNFNSYGKLFTTHTDENGSTINVLTRTSDDGFTFDGWFPIALDGTIQSVKKRFIQVRVNFFAAFGDYGYSVLNKFDDTYVDKSNGLKLKRDYEFDMVKDDSWTEEGSLHKKQVIKDDWLRLDKLSIPLTVGQIDKTLILHDGEYKKWNEEQGGQFEYNLKMTSNTTPAPYVASASSIVAGGYEAYKAFNGTMINITDCWHSNGTTSAWLQIDFGSPKEVNKFKLMGRKYSNAESTPSTFYIKGSNDGVIFENIFYIENVSWIQDEIKIFEMNTTYNYRYYRLDVVKPQSNIYVIVSKLEFLLDTEIIPAHWTTISSTLPTSTQFIEKGIDSLSPLLDRRIETLHPLPMSLKSDILSESGKVFSVILDLKKYMDIRNLSTNTTGQVKLCNVGDYENAIDYTSVSDIYNNFNDLVEVLVFTDEAITGVDLIVKAKWSPIDELEGDFEVVTWTDEDKSTAQRTLELSSIPHSQFLKFQVPITLLSKVGQLEVINGQGGIRFLFSHDNTIWYKWNGSNFVNVDASTNQLIAANGNTSDEVNSINQNEFMNKWNYGTFSLGVYLEDDIRDNFTSSVTDLILTESYPAATSKLSNASFYILNTTAKIDIALNGLNLDGTLSDDDLTRVQYRVKLNGLPYYPSDGNFTSLSPSPTSINLTLKSDDIKIGDWNDLEVEFQDYFGTTDSWQVQFLGKYSGLMFKSPQGDYYSTDIGQVLQYLDFGLVLTGQTTVEQTIVLKNEYGYRVKDVQIYANTSKFSEGLKVEFSKDTEQEWLDRLLLNTPLENDEEFVFNIRMRSDITTIPTGQGMFNIHVMAKKD